MAHVPPSPVRSDVRRNRRALLDAARELFASEHDVPMSRVATRAGVGHATIYRHFPDRSTLAAAVALEALEACEEHAAADPELRLEDLLGDLVALSAQLGPLRPLMAEGEGAAVLPDVRRRMAALFDRPLRAAKRDGRVAPDLTRGDMVLLLQMVTGGIDNATQDPATRTRTARRALALARASLRP